VSVSSPVRFRSRSSDYRGGWPSYSHRPASIDPSRAHSIAVLLSHRPRSPRCSNFGGRRLTASRVTDRPRLISWSSLHPCTSPISDVPCRRRGHRLVGSRTDRKLCSTCVLRCTLRFDPRDLDRRRIAPCGAFCRRSRTPSVVPHPAELACPAAEPRVLSCYRRIRATRAPFSPRIEPPRASAPGTESFDQCHAVGSPCGSPSVVTRDALGRLLPSHFLRTSTRASSVQGSVRRSSRLPEPEESPGSRQSDPLRWERTLSPLARLRPFWALSSHRGPYAVRTSDAPVASSLNSGGARAHTRLPRGRLDRLLVSAVNVAPMETVRGVFHRSRTFAPRRPFERPAPDFASRAALPPHEPVLDAFSPACHPRGCTGGPGSRSRAPLPTVGRACLRASATLDDFCNLFRRAGTPFELPDPRTRVGIFGSHCSPPPTDAGCVGHLDALPHLGPASHGPRAPAFARCAPLAWTSRTAGPSAGAKASRALFERCARALLVGA
jgi:hypothetical protein